MSGRRYSFGGSSFKELLAHGGKRPIFAATVLERSGSAFDFIDLVVMPPGSDIGLHTHGIDNEEVYVVISGTGSMTSNGDTFQVGAGDVILNPPGGTHSLINNGTYEMKIVVLQVHLHV